MSRTNSKKTVIAVVDAAEVRLGENMKLKLLLSRLEAQQKDITYLVRHSLHLLVCVLHRSVCLFQCAQLDEY